LQKAGAHPTRAGLDERLAKINSFDASGLISPQNVAEKIPGQCWLAAQFENGTWHRVKPDPKSGFVCDPKGFYPARYKGV
jgi:hypothetical protein